MTICKINAQVGQVLKVFFVVCHWEKASFKAEITDGRNVWSAMVTEEKIRKEMCPRDSDQSAFFTFLRDSLSSSTGSKVTYSLSMVQQNSCLLEWKMSLDEDMFLKQKLLFAPYPQETNKERVQHLLGWLMDREHASSALLETQKTRFGDMEADLKKALAMIEQMTREKEKMELELYERFVHVLNAKKAHIDELDKKMKQMREQLDSLQMPSPVKGEPAAVCSSPLQPVKRERTSNVNNSDEGSNSNHDESKRRKNQGDASSAHSPSSPKGGTVAARKRVRAVAAVPSAPAPVPVATASTQRSKRGGRPTAAAPVAQASASPSPAVLGASSARPPSNKVPTPDADAMQLIQGFD